MTEKQKKMADCEMYNLWMRFVYEEAMSNEKNDYRHLDRIIRDEGFIKKYLQCGKKICACWIFIFCDGEFGYFDGYKYSYEIPVALAKLLDIETYLPTKELTVKNGSYVIKTQDLWG